MINQNLLLTGDDGYNLTNSLRFRSSASAYLNRTPSVAATSTTKGTISIWFKGIGQANQYLVGKNSGTIFYLYFNSSNQLVWQNGGSNTFITTQVFRDPSAWYHLVASWDTTQATSSNRQSLYLNGQQITAFGTTNNLGLNAVVSWFDNDGNVRGIGSYTAGGYFDGYMTEINAIDGQALTPSSFGETSSTTGVWIPKKYTGTYGTNGFYLPFTDNSALTTSSNVGLGKDFSGNSNYWTTNNISITSGSTYDSMTDVPTLTSATAANYAVLNAAIPKTYVSIADGNLKSAGTSSTDSDTAVATIGVSSGKWYWEDRIGAISSSVYPIFGAGRNILSSFIGKYPGDSSVGGFGIVVGNGNIVREGSIVTTVTALVANDVVGFALDLGALTCAIYKNNSLIYTVTSLTAGTYYPMANEYSSSNSTHNYGQQPFAYTPPTGFIRLNTFNLPTPTIGATASTTANKYFDATLYTGNGSTQTITNSGSMQPDFVWYKGRDTTFNHALFDVTRGVLQRLSSNLTTAESTTAGSLTAFNSNGFSVGNDAGANQSTNTYVAWQWRASNATAVTNTAGSITSTVSANTSAGFSIVTYTGTGANATVGHGLGVAPSMVIVKNRSAGSTNWCVYHVSVGNQYATLLNSTSAPFSNSNYWNNTTPTSTVFSLGNGTDTNGNTNNLVAYCFAAVSGYSAFGSYTGNGSTDGTFVYTGFRPRFVLWKNITQASQWILLDTARNTYNIANAYLEPNTSDSENTASTVFDMLSNGFKLRNSGGTDFNENANTYIYMAFAESPFKYANAR